MRHPGSTARLNTRCHIFTPTYTLFSVYISPNKNHQGGYLERSAVDEAGEELEGLTGGSLGHLVATALHGHEGERALQEERKKIEKEG